MAENYGATLEAWHHWSVTLGLAEHLLPVISNPGAMISPDSNMKALGKTPSRYNYRQEAAGFAKWTDHHATLREIAKWELEPDYGICVQARAVRAIDIDVPDQRKAKTVLEVIERALPLHFFPQRYRENTGKVLLPFLFDGPMPKRVVPVDGGIVEFLGDGQQWIAEGAYLTANPRVAARSNTPQVALGRYLWRGGWPQALPELTSDELEALWDTLVTLLATGDAQIARQRREGSGVDTSAIPGQDDAVADWLVLNWEIREAMGRGGELFIRCPFDAEHSSDSGPTETVYYPGGTGGYERGHFKCLHSHCLKYSDGDYLEALGYQPDMSDAPDLPAVVGEEGEPGTELAVAPVARYMVDKQGRKENRVYNHELFLQSADCGKRIAWDDFSAQIIWCPAGDAQGEERWGLFSDEHYVQIVRQMDRNGFVPQAPVSIRGAVLNAAMSNPVDLAAAWAARLPEWDGVERIERFWTTYAAAPDSEYIRAVGRYTWTAQAGRLLDPGCQADMAPILVSEQGKRKTSLVAAIAPQRQMFVEINLTDRDDDTSRKMRGKLVAELGELRGLKGRAHEDVKSFITRREEQWTPKYQEFAKTFKRRFVFYGTTNEDDFLGDPTGERRWLPFHVGQGAQLDVEGVERDREQLWTEAIAMWRRGGVDWQDAERLAQDEHGRFKGDVKWVGKVRTWLLTAGALDDPELAPCDMDFAWGVEDVVVGIGQKTDRDADIMAVGKALKALGCTKKRVWNCGWRYAANRATLEVEQ
jgi:hypothetical protein